MWGTSLLDEIEIVMIVYTQDMWNCGMPQQDYTKGSVHVWNWCFPFGGTWDEAVEIPLFFQGKQDTSCKGFLFMFLVVIKYVGLQCLTSFPAQGPFVFIICRLNLQIFNGTPCCSSFAAMLLLELGN